MLLAVILRALLRFLRIELNSVVCSHSSPNQIADDHVEVLDLLCQQGKLLECSCQFYFALKYYFAGLQFFLKLKPLQRSGIKAPSAPQDKQTNEKMVGFFQRFQSLFENLLPLSNQQVCCVQCPTAHFQTSSRKQWLLCELLSQ
jgi:hypothetical protein